KRGQKTAAPTRNAVRPLETPMNRSPRNKPWMYGIGAAVLVSVFPVAVVLYINRPIPGPQAVNAKEPYQPQGDDDPVSTTPSLLAVDVVHPRKGMDYEIEQPGSV